VRFGVRTGPARHSTHSRNTPKQQPNTQASAASNKQRTHQLRPTPPSALSGSSTRGPSTHPKSYVVERAIPRLHRSPTRKTLPPSDPHRPTADALPVRLPVVKVLPIPHVIIIIITATVRKYESGPITRKPGQHQPLSTASTNRSMTYATSNSSSMGLAKPRHAWEARAARDKPRTSSVVKTGRATGTPNPAHQTTQEKRHK
jgi:hypothetical protein